MEVKAILDTKGIDVAIIEPAADLAFALSCWRHVPLARWSFWSRRAGRRYHLGTGHYPRAGQAPALALEQPVAEKVITCTRGNDERINE